MTVCPTCDPYDSRPESSNQFGPICPTCDMDAAEHAYRERILADSAAVYAQEVREFRAKREAEKALRNKAPRSLVSA